MKKIIYLIVGIVMVANSLLAAAGMDFNGDGVDDLVNVWPNGDDEMSASVFLSTGTAFGQASWADGQGDYDELQRWFHGDFDGDFNIGLPHAVILTVVRWPMERPGQIRRPRPTISRFEDNNRF